MRIDLHQRAASLDSDVETPISLFIDVIENNNGILLESAERDGRWGRFSLVAGECALALMAKKGLLQLDFADPCFAGLRAFEGLPYHEGLRAVMAALHLHTDTSFAALPGITRGLYGYLSYDLAGVMEKKLAGVIASHSMESVLVLPRRVFLFDHTYNRLTELSLYHPDGQPLVPLETTIKAAPAGVQAGPMRCGETMESFTGKVRDARGLITQGEVTQVVLSVPFSAPYPGDALPLYRRLRKINPSPYMFFMRHEGMSLAVSSPEVMISCDAGKLRLCPIAGTRPRGNNLDQDNLFEEELAADPKEQAEHAMLVDLGRNDLGRIARTGSVVIEKFMEVERFSHVMHLTSYLGAALDEGLDAVDVIRATFPAGTVSGAPKIRAMEIIADYEDAPRGPYAGAMGWLGLDKDSVSLDLGITIRSLWCDGATVQWQAGAGIVLDSEPESEWRECHNKAMVIRTAIETTTPTACADKGAEHVSPH